jgi:hypothetical protein
MPSFLLDKFGDLAQQVFGAIRLAQKASVVGDLGGSRLDLARRYDKQHLRPALVYLTGKLQTVAAGRHLNIGEEQPHVFAVFHHFQRLVGVVGLQDGVAVRLKKFGCVEPQKLIVIGYEDRGVVDAWELGHLA